MPREIEQPASPGEWRMRSVEELTPKDPPARQWTYDERRNSQPRAVPATPTTITHLDIPFEDVFALVLKILMAQLIIATPFAFVIWLAFLR